MGKAAMLCERNALERNPMPMVRITDHIMRAIYAEQRTDRSYGDPGHGAVAHPDGTWSIWIDTLTLKHLHSVQLPGEPLGDTIEREIACADGKARN